jgi:diaminohydroxyphosphoribosylaminopyrimidine deaminase / 5-amino-6-(5-phosphoribosylamino)uracil reductase
MHEEHIDFMKRCIQLAKLGEGHVSPNPMVGAVLVHNNRIIGEGYHEIYGEAHAEVNCINSVKQADKNLIRESVLYVSLEPCSHYGKTPPCADLVIRNKIPRVVIGCKDVFTEVNGKGIERLKQNGIDVTVDVLENECKNLNKAFFTFQSLQRPYVILKWAQTADNKIANTGNKRLLISEEITTKLVHKWRAETTGILIGTNTAKTDNPKLTNRLWSGNSPVRLIIDLDLQLSQNSKIFKNDAPTIIFNLQKKSPEFHEPLKNEVYYYQISDRDKTIEEILKACYELKIQSILIEGGKKLLQSFIDKNLWDEARIIINTKMFIGNGLAAPKLNNVQIQKQFSLGNDLISIYKRV